MELPFNHKHHFNFIDSEEFNENNSFNIIKEHREHLISKRKEFIQNYRNKQRLLLKIEGNNSDKSNQININDNYINMNDIESEPDPITRIILLEMYLKKNELYIDINFINNHLEFLKSIFSDFKKILFDYENSNIDYHIIINRYIIYCILSLLIENDSNPLMDEFNYDFLSNINTFCFHYLYNDNFINLGEKLDILRIYILLLLNNLIRIHPDVESLKNSIDIRKCIIFFYNKYFNFINKNQINENNNNNVINTFIDLNKNNKYEFCTLTYLKLIESCILLLHLKNDEIKELIEIILSLIYYYYINNDIKLLIYSLETLVNTKKVYLLLDNKNYNKFLIEIINKIISCFNYNDKNEQELIKIKLFFELYLEQLIYCLDYKNFINQNINFILYLKEEIIIFFKNLYFQFNQSLSTRKIQEININELKVIIKVTKIFIFYFKIRNEKNFGLITTEQMNHFQTILCSNFISKNNEGSSLYDILINIFTHLVESQEKYSLKICNLILNIFNNIYSLVNLDYKKDFSYIKNFQLFLIENYSVPIKLFRYLNLKKYGFLIENMIELVNKILFFCEQIDLNEKNSNSLFEKIKKDLFGLNVFEEIENIEYDIDINDINIKISAQQIRNNFLN